MGFWASTEVSAARVELKQERHEGSAPGVAIDGVRGENISFMGGDGGRLRLYVCSRPADLRVSVFAVGVRCRGLQPDRVERAAYCAPEFVRSVRRPSMGRACVIYVGGVRVGNRKGRSAIYGWSGLWWIRTENRRGRAFWRLGDAGQGCVRSMRGRVWTLL